MPVLRLQPLHNLQCSITFDSSLWQNIGCHTFISQLLILEVVVVKGSVINLNDRMQALGKGRCLHGQLFCSVPSNSFDNIVLRTLKGIGKSPLVARSSRDSNLLQEIVDFLRPSVTPSDRYLNVEMKNQSDKISPIVMALEKLSVSDILSVVRSDGQEQRLSSDTSVLGNDPQHRFWYGDLQSIPAYMGPFQGAFVPMSVVSASKEDLRAALLKLSLLLRPGGVAVVWNDEKEYCIDENMLKDASFDLCLELHSIMHDANNSQICLLRIPDNYQLPHGPIHLEGSVVTGYGRGSKQLGVPTANIAPEDVARQIEGLPDGVYFGWARVWGMDSGRDGDVHKMVMNIGKRPTFVKDNSLDLSVEVHVMHPFASDFYGKHIKALVVGYLRPEMKFSGIKELLNRIKTDIGIARSQLDSDRWKEYARNDFFSDE